MSSTANAARLTALTRELLIHWRLTRESWTDAKAIEFEARYLQELESALTAAVTGIEGLESVIRQVEEDCE